MSNLRPTRIFVARGLGLRVASREAGCRPLQQNSEGISQPPPLDMHSLFSIIISLCSESAFCITSKLLMTRSKINLLSLDGGGVRGLSSLIILKRLMDMIDDDDPPKPCEYFDMIAGTSTGG